MMRSTRQASQRCFSQLQNTAARQPNSLHHAARLARRSLSSKTSQQPRALLSAQGQQTQQQHQCQQPYRTRSDDSTRSAHRQQFPAQQRAQYSDHAQAEAAKNADPFYTTSLGHSSSDMSRPLLEPSNLFHPFSKSPSEKIRNRAAFMKQHAFCPHPGHQRTRMPISPMDPESRKPLPEDVEAQTALPPANVNFECPDCGIPVACCKEHWMEDFEAHLEVCETLRQVNEDDHDILSGRSFPEFKYPAHQISEEFLINMSNWDTFLYTRDFPAVNDERSMRHLTRLLTYPMTITSVIHELSPYRLRGEGRLTQEGLRSLSALRYIMHPPRMGEGDTVSGIRLKPPPIRLFILGARAESSLPRDVWQQLTYCFPRSSFHLIFIGPEAMENRPDEFPLPARTPGNPFGGLVEDRISHQLKVTTYVDYFHTMYEAQHFHPFDPYFDVFLLFHPGLGHPVASHEWAPTVAQLLETKCPVICTGYTNWDMERDYRWLRDTQADEVDLLLKPGENIFRSLRWNINDYDPTDVWCANWGVWAFRGKRYEAERRYVDVVMSGPA